MSGMVLEDGGWSAGGGNTVDAPSRLWLVDVVVVVGVFEPDDDGEAEPEGDAVRDDEFEWLKARPGRSMSVEGS
jgi:hypothetical protein